MKSLPFSLGRSGRHALAIGVLVLVGTPPIARTQTEFSTASGTTAQNFDTLANSTPAAGIPYVNDTTLMNDPAALPTLDGWSLYDSSNVPIGIYRAGTGSSSTGSFYSFGAAADTERSFGGVGSNSLAGYMVFAATNTSEVTLTQFTLGFDGEQWRNGGTTAPQTMVFEYGIGATFEEAVFTAPGGNFDWTSPVVGTSAGAVNGNVEGLVANRGGALRGLEVQTGQTLFLRWVERNDAGSDHGLSIDNFNLSWAGQVIAPLYWDTNGATAGIGGTGVWREGAGAPNNWNLLANGTGAPQPADPAKRQIFGGTAGTVTIDAAGVSATLGLQFDVGGYTITGGPLTLGPSIATINTAAGLTTINAPIQGTGGVAKQGEGDLKLTGNNTFTGTVAINGGTLVLTSDATLGNAANSVNLGGGNLRVDETFTMGVAREITGAGTVRIIRAKKLTTLGRVNLGNLELRSDSPDQSAGGTLALNGTDNRIGALSIVDPTQIEAPNGVTLNGNVTLGSTVATSKITGNVILSGVSQRFTVPDVATENVDFDITGSVSGVGRLLKFGTGTMRIGGAGESFAGGVQLGDAGANAAEGGRLIISGRNALGTGALPMYFNDGVLEAATPLTGANAIPIGVSIGAGQINSATFDGADMEFLGVNNIFRGSGSSSQRVTLNTNVIFTGEFGVSSTASNTSSSGLSLDGTGSLTVAAATNGNDLPITLTGPTLIINGELSSSAASVNVASGTLTGSGKLVSFVVVGDGVGKDSVIAPGNGVGTLTTGGLTLTSDATYRMELNSTQAIADMLISEGEVNLGEGVAALTISDLAGAGTKLTLGLQFTLLSNSSQTATTGFFAGRPDSSAFTLGPNIFQIRYGVGSDLNDIILRVVPEPSSAALLALGAAASALRRRRSRR